MDKKKVWIHCRVNNESERNLLRYQRDRVVSTLTDKDCRIIGVTSEISKGVNPYSRELEIIKTHARRHDIDYVLVYDETRLLIYKDMFMEFKMFCERLGVQIVSLEHTQENFHISNFK